MEVLIPYAAFTVIILALLLRHDRERMQWEQREAAYIERLTGVSVEPWSVPAIPPRQYGDDAEWAIEQERLTR